MERNFSRSETRTAPNSTMELVLRHARRVFTMSQIDYVVDRLAWL